MNEAQEKNLEQEAPEQNVLVDIEESNDQTTEAPRSEEHTSELQSQSTNSYAVFCLKKKTKTTAFIYRKTSSSGHTCIRMRDDACLSSVLNWYTQC